MNFIKSIHNFIRDKKIIRYFLIFFIVYYLLSDFTFATDSKFEEIKATTQTVWEGLLKWISMILALFTYLSTVFLSPTWLNGTLFWLNVYFKEIWILVSNLVYFIFAFILIWIAFMNIIWKSGETYQLKQALPKFIVWVLIVPFSWFLVQFILSISAVLTVSWLTLPFDTFASFNSSLSEVKIPKDCTLNLESFLGTDSSAAPAAWWASAPASWWAAASDSFIHCEDDKVPVTEVASSWDSNDSIFWILGMYTYGLLSLDTVGSVDHFDLKSVKNMWDLVVKILFDLLFVFVYSLLMIALGLVLMVRWIYIWIYIMISPVFWLMYFLGKKDWWWDWFFSKFNLKEFIALAMMPVYTMLALSFGLLFIYVVWHWLWDNGNQQKSMWWDTLSIEDDWIMVWQFTLHIKWQVSKLDNGTGLLKGVWGAWLWIVWSLILKVFGIVILWWALMAAMKTSSITKTIIAPLETFWQQVWKIITSAPANIPLFPTWKGGMQSMNSMSNIWTNINSAITWRSSDRSTKFMNEHLPFLNDTTTNNASQQKASIQAANDPRSKAIEAKKILTWVEWDANKIYTNPWTRENLYQLAKKISTEDQLKDYKSSSDIDSLAKVAKIFDQIEKTSTDYHDLLPWGVWITEGAFKNAVRDLHNSNNASWNGQQANGTWWPSVTAWTVTPWSYKNGPVEITINNNNKIDKINWPDGHEIAINDNIKWLNMNTLTKTEFINKLKSEWITEVNATKIAEAIWDKLKLEPANP